MRVADSPCARLKPFLDSASVVSTDVSGLSASASTASTDSDNNAAAAGHRASPPRPSALERDLRALFNRVSPSNVTAICTRLCNLQVSSPADLDLMAVLLLDQALSDSFYSELYAFVARRLSLDLDCSTPIPQRDSQGDGAAGSGCGDRREAAAGFECFSDVFFTHFRQRFSVYFGDARLLGEEVAQADAGDDGHSKLTAKERARAYVRLMGHLCAFGVIPDVVLQSCLKYLLSPPSRFAHGDPWPPEAWIECACELLQVMGKLLLLTQSGKETLQSALDRLLHWKDIRNSHGGLPPRFVYPSRIRFRIQDIIDSDHLGPSTSPAKSIPEKVCRSKQTAMPLQRREGLASVLRKLLETRDSGGADTRE